MYFDNSHVVRIVRTSSICFPFLTVESVSFLLGILPSHLVTGGIYECYEADIGATVT